MRYDLGLGQRQIAQSCSIGQGTVSEYLKRAEAAGVSWPLPECWQVEGMFLRELRPKKDGKEHSYRSLVETVRTPEGPRQRTLCYLGELTTSAQARWQKTIAVFKRTR